MARIAEPELDAIGDPERALVAQADELPDRCLGFLLGVDRRDGRQALPGALPRNELGVVALHVGAVLEHHGGEVSGAVGGVDVAGETALHQRRQRAGVVNVRVAHHDGFDGSRVERKAVVAFNGFQASALENAAIQHQFRAVDVQQVSRTSGGLRCSAKRPFHILSSSHVILKI